MKKFFRFLSVVCLVLGLAGTVVDSLEKKAEYGYPDSFFAGNSYLFLAAGVFFALVFFLISLLFRKSNSIFRIYNGIYRFFATAKSDFEDFVDMEPILKKRFFKFTLIGDLLTLASIASYVVAFVLVFVYDQIFLLSVVAMALVVIATLLLIAGLTVRSFASQSRYNRITDAVKMVVFKEGMTIEDVYEAYKNVWTPYGSCYYIKFTTNKDKALVWGPGATGQYVYLTLGDGETGYLSVAVTGNFVENTFGEPSIKPEETGEDYNGNLCFSANLLNFMGDLYKSLRHYGSSGEVLPLKKLAPSEVYYFDEHFKLTGQKFSLKDGEGRTVYNCEATIPFINLYVRDLNDSEIFKITKELGHALATYRFEYRGQEYGSFNKEFTFIRDTFTMKAGENKFELTEYAGFFGHNFKASLNGREIGSIMDNLNIELRNFVFDNSIIVCYDREYLPLLAGFAVMIARELARDRESERSGSPDKD